MIKIFEVKLMDPYAGIEYEFTQFDESAYWGTTDRVQVKSIIKHIKSRLRKEGYLFADLFEYRVDTEDIRKV